MKSLREVYQELGVSRTTLQGWLYDILDWPKQEKTDNTALVIGEEVLSTLWQIRFFKQLKYSNRKIKTILNDPDFDVSRSLEQQIAELTSQKEELERLIKAATVMKETGISPSLLHFGSTGLEGVDYPKTMDLLGLFGDNMVESAVGDIDFNDFITDDESDEMISMFEHLMKMAQESLPITSPEVQHGVKNLHQLVATILSDSVIILSYIGLCFAPEGEIGRDIDNEYGKGSSVFFINALQHYCNEGASSALDQRFYCALENIEKLARAKHTTSSSEVQAEVQNIHDFFMKATGRFSTYTLPLLKGIGVTFGSTEFRNAFENGAKRGVLWFTSRAIEIYCSKHENDERGIIE